MDPDALAIARENIASQEMEDEITFLHRQIAASAETATSKEVPLFSPDAPELKEEIEEEDEEGEKTTRRRKVDTVVMNPPFGSWNKGIDMVFLEVACKVSRSPVIRGGAARSPKAPSRSPTRPSTRSTSPQHGSSSSAKPSSLASKARSLPR